MMKEKNVLSVGLMDSTIKHNLSTTIVFETPKKWFIVLVKTYEEGAITVVRGQCIGGCKIYTEGLEFSGTLGICTEYLNEDRLLSAAHIITNYDENNNIGKKYTVKMMVK